MLIKFDKNKKYATIAIYAFFALAAVSILILLVMKKIKPVGIFSNFIATIAPIVYGFVIAYILNPILIFFENKVFKFMARKKPRKKLRRAISLIITYALALAFVSLFVYVLISQTIGSFSDLIEKLPTYSAKLEEYVLNLIDKFESTTGISTGIDLEKQVGSTFDKVTNYISENWMNLFNIIFKVVTLTKNIFLGLIISIYMLLSKEKLIAQMKKGSHAFMSENRYNKIAHIITTTDRTFGKFITGKLIDSFIVAILFYIVLTVLKFPYVPVIAFIMGISNLIPFFGPWLGSVPSGLIILIARPDLTLVFVLIVLVIQQLDGNLIDPMIVGDSIGLDAIWIIIAIIVMTGLLGVLGMFIGVPIFSVIYILIKEKVNKNLEAKGKSLELETYYPESK